MENIDNLTWKNKIIILSGSGVSFSKIPVKNGIAIEYKNDKNEDRGVLIVALDDERLKSLKLALNNLKG
jgi:hypothetical protein